MWDEPETADGARSAPRSSGAGRSGRNADDDWLADLERPPGYRGHSEGGRGGDVPERPELTHQSDPYDYGADPGPSPSWSDPATRAGGDVDEEPLTLDRELLARELAADRARRSAGSEPTSEVPRTSPTWPAPDDARIAASRQPSRPGDPFARDPFGPDPFGPPTGPLARVGPGGRFDDDRAMAPFSAPAAMSSPTPRLEQALDAAYRWRTALGLGLAGLVTLGVVVAYRPSNDDDRASTDSAAPGTESAIDSVTDFTPTTGATVDPSADSDGQQEVGSAVDGRSTTTGAATSDPSSVAGPTTADDGEEPDPTTAPTGTSPDPTTAPTQPDATTTTAAPTTSSSAPAAAVILETEDGELTEPAVVLQQHAGFTGSGYVGHLITTGAAVTVQVESISDGTIDYTIRYASPPQGPEGDRTLTLSVNGEAVDTVVFPSTGGATTWSTVSGTVALQQGLVELTLSVAEGDTGSVNIDYVSLS